MEIEHTTQKPRSITIAKFVGLFFVFLSIPLFFLLRLNEMTLWASILFALLPLVQGLSLGFTSRPHQLNVSNISDINDVYKYVISFLVSEGLENISEDAGGMWMRSTRAKNQLLNNWFGTELIRVNKSPSHVQVSGHGRYINALESKIRFGRK